MSQQVSDMTILRRRQVETRTGLSRSTIYERMRAGSFPQAINLGDRAVGWIESEINDWLLQRVKKSRLTADAEQPTINIRNQSSK